VQAIEPGTAPRLNGNNMSRHAIQLKTASDQALPCDLPWPNAPSAVRARSTRIGGAAALLVAMALSACGGGGGGGSDDAPEPAASGPYYGFFYNTETKTGGEVTATLDTTATSVSGPWKIGRAHV
jgi:hypothetical protein